jgi:hypothetical protein
MALAMVMVFLFALTVALAAGFMVNAGERRVDDDGLQATNVMAMAEGGLERALVDRASIGLTSPPPTTPESVRVNVTGGIVDVIVTPLRPVVGSQPSLYLIRAHAKRTQKTSGLEVSAQETLTELAAWQVGTMNVQAGWSSLSGITKNGTSGAISGVPRFPCRAFRATSDQPGHWPAPLRSSIRLGRPRRRPPRQIPLTGPASCRGPR